MIMDPTQPTFGRAAPQMPDPSQAAMQQALMLQAIRGAAAAQGQQGADQSAAMGSPGLASQASPFGMSAPGPAAGSPVPAPPQMPTPPVDPSTMTGGLAPSPPAMPVPPQMPGQQGIPGMGADGRSPFGLMGSPNPVANALMSPIPGS